MCEAEEEEDAVPSLFRRWSSCPMLDRFHESADRAASLDSSGRGTKVRRVDVLAVGEPELMLPKGERPGGRPPMPGAEWRERAHVTT
jgi:hypothetical protein